MLRPPPALPAHRVTYALLTMHPLLSLDARPVVGHRGNSAHAPENTIESFDQAVALGVDALEFDVRVSRDGIPVVIHDPTLARTVGRRVAVAALSAAELATADAGAAFTRDGGVKIGRAHV